MVDATIHEALDRQLEELPVELWSCNVELDFARSLTGARIRGEPGEELLRFAGSIDAESVREMAEAIEAGCEQIGADGW